MAWYGWLSIAALLAWIINLNSSLFDARNAIRDLSERLSKVETRP